MKRLSLLVLFLFATSNLIFSQIPVRIGFNQPGTTAVSSTAPTHAVPYNHNDKSVHIQFIYTLAELNASGAAAASKIDSIGWNVVGQIGGPLSSYTIKMKNTTAGSAASYDNIGLITVFNPKTLIAAVDTGWYMLALDKPFYWNGNGNILVDVCWGMNSLNSATGQIRHYSNSTIANERIFIKSNTAAECGVACNSAQLFKPYVAFNTCLTSSVVVYDTICAGEAFAFAGQNISTTGIYRDTLVSLSGCDSLVSLYLTVTNIITGVFHLGDSITANVPNLNYQWLNCNANYSVIPGANGRSYRPIVSGSYAVAITVNGCADTSVCTPITVTGIDQVAFADYTISPNPSKGLFLFNVAAKYDGVQYEIINDQGRTIFTGRLIINNRIDLSKYPSGIYFIRFQGSELKLLKL